MLSRAYLVIGVGAALSLAPACDPPQGDDDTLPSDDDDSTGQPDDDDDTGADDDTTGQPDDDDTEAPPAPCFPEPPTEPDCPSPVERPEDEYYDDIDPGSATLKSDLHSLISDLDSVGYEGLWDAFSYTDRDASGHVWDIYSDIPEGTAPYSYSFDDQCGQYDGEGDCFNREHSWPSSWANEDSKLRSDLFHVYPTDGYVNCLRDNLPYGVVDEIDWQSLNGSRKGTCEHDGQPTTAFEPIDAYKGDLARTYFYVAVAYAGSGWSSNEMVDGARIGAEAEAMLRQWHADDPVSDKEIERNDAIFDLQDNRNPFIDHPDWVCEIDDF